MKYFLFIMGFAISLQPSLTAQPVKQPPQKQQIKRLALNNHPSFEKALMLETSADTTANISFGDLDADGHLDMLLVKGRHWPIVDKVLLGDGKGGIKEAYNLGDIADRSYTGALADFNGDGFPDIAVSNDVPNRKLIYLNDGKGHFTIGSEFGKPAWPTRNMAMADINRDGLPDLILANRGTASDTKYICLNQAKGSFNTVIAFAPYPCTTITPADFNGDGWVDLVVPHREGGQAYIYTGGPDMTFPDSRRIPFGAADAAIRSAAVADFSGDGIADIVAIDVDKGVSLYMGQKSQIFSAGVSFGDASSSPYALTIADLNQDGRTDIIVGHVNAPSTIFYNDGMGKFTSLAFGDSNGTVYGFAVADFNEDGVPDIAAARSEAINVLYFGSRKQPAKNK